MAQTVHQFSSFPLLLKSNGTVHRCCLTSNGNKKHVKYYAFFAIFSLLLVSMQVICLLYLLVFFVYWYVNYNITSFLLLSAVNIYHWHVYICEIFLFSALQCYIKYCCYCLPRHFLVLKRYAQPLSLYFRLLLVQAYTVPNSSIASE